MKTDSLLSQTEDLYSCIYLQVVPAKCITCTDVTKLSDFKTYHKRNL